MRCGVEKCRTRFTLKKAPHLYKRRIKCPTCGDYFKVRSVEAERQRELAKQDTCRCSAYPFPHRKGSMRMCDHHRLRDVDITDDEYREYMYCLETPRSG